MSSLSLDNLQDLGPTGPAGPNGAVGSTGPTGPPQSGFVDLTTNQTVDGIKTYSQTAFFEDGVHIRNVGNNQVKLIAEVTGTNANITIPSTSNATLATLANLNNYVDLTTNQNVNGQKTLGDRLITITGTQSVPAIQFGTVSPAGLFSSAANTLNFGFSGVSFASISSSNITSSVVYRGPLGSATSPTYTIGSNNNDGMYCSALGTLNFSTAGANRFAINSTLINSTVRYQGPIGSLTGVTYGLNAANLGMYSPAANQLALACNGTQTFFQSATQTALPVAGTNLLPSLYFSTDTTSGIYRPAANQLGVAITTALVGLFSSTGLAITGNLTTTTGFRCGSNGTTFGEIRQGSVTLTNPSIANNTNFDQPVTLSPAMSTTPNVQVSIFPQGGSGFFDSVFVSINANSSSSFTIRLRNISGSATTGNCILYWVART